MSNKEKSFLLPIEFLKNKSRVLENLKTDLELEKSVDSSNNPIYNYIFDPQTDLGKKCISSWSKYYSTDKTFLKESQNLYKNIDKIPFEKTIIENMVKSWRQIRQQNNFVEKYQYIEWEKLKWLNKSTPFLTVLSFYNISAPVLQLIAPFFILLVPFAVLKVMKLPISWNSYYKILMENIKHHAIGKLVLSFNSVSLGQKIYILFCLGMYLYNIYQNIISCYRFYQNSYYICNQFETINLYLDYTIEKIKYLKSITTNYSSYKPFNKYLTEYQLKLQNFHNIIRSLPLNNSKINKIVYVGKLMKYFFILYDSDELENMINFTFGFHGYIDTILGINKNITHKKINKCKFSKKLCFKLTNMYHPSIENPIKNTIDINKNIIITGPNAAGKTTSIKATIINLLLTQQIGFGFFDKCTTGTFDYIHCYLNIPDTCSRDSLFQSEARRCKNILTTIEKNHTKRHFCIFDELYSGTNPYEAISSAYSYLDHISQSKNVRFLLTTHYIKLCELLKKNKKIRNKSMKTIMKKDNPIYTYKIVNGVSTIKGGVSVLKNLNYPKKIVDLTITILDKL